MWPWQHWSQLLSVVYSYPCNNITSNFSTVTRCCQAPKGQKRTINNTIFLTAVIYKIFPFIIALKSNSCLSIIKPKPLFSGVYIHRPSDFTRHPNDWRQTNHRSPLISRRHAQHPAMYDGRLGEEDWTYSGWEFASLILLVQYFIFFFIISEILEG